MHPHAPCSQARKTNVVCRQWPTAHHCTNPLGPCSSSSPCDLCTVPCHLCRPWPIICTCNAKAAVPRHSESHHSSELAASRFCDGSLCAEILPQWIIGRSAAEFVGGEGARRGNGPQTQAGKEDAEAAVVPTLVFVSLHTYSTVSPLSFPMNSMIAKPQYNTRGTVSNWLRTNTHVSCVRI
jgi:hypothetical protein